MSEEHGDPRSRPGSETSSEISSATGAGESSQGPSSRGIDSMTDQGLEALLRRATRLTLIVGVLGAIALWIGSGWRNAAMMATGTAISAASIYEWRRLARFIAAKLDSQQTPPGAFLAMAFFFLRLLIFAAAIYVSLKWFQGSAIALLCGLALAVLALVWEALRLLRE
jgi:hypothetical protein